jgi:hypothetical protein
MKLLWMYWNVRKPKLIQQIEQHNLKNLPTWTIRYLDDTNIHDYIHAFPKNFNIFIPQHKADWIRLYLISHYGGVWCDASIIINSEKAMNELWEKTETHDFVGFYNGKKVNGIYEKIENWCFASKKGGKLVTEWFKEYNKAIQEGFKAYRERIVKDTNLDLYIKKKEFVDYFTVYFCLQYVLQHQPVPSMYMMNATDSMFKLGKICKKVYKIKKPSKCIMNLLKTKKMKLPYVKLTRHERKTRINIDSYFKD